MKTKAQVFQELIEKILGKEVELEEVNDRFQETMGKGTATAEGRNEVVADGLHRV